MREIKFRGKAVMPIEELDEQGFEHDNGWVYGNLVMYGETPYIVGDFVEVDYEYTVNEFWVHVHPESVGQFTSLKDKNGKEIYEGDIIEFNDCSYARSGGIIDDEILKSKVEFDRGAFWANGILLIDVITNDEEVEVIGNIYENPELLNAYHDQNA